MAVLEPGQVNDGQFLDIGLSGPLRGIPDDLTERVELKGKEKRIRLATGLGAAHE